MKTVKDIATKSRHALPTRWWLWPRAQSLIVVASIVLLIDSELLSVGAPAARFITHLFNDSAVISVVVWTLLIVLLVAMALWLTPQIWKVERDLNENSDRQSSRH